MRQSLLFTAVISALSFAQAGYAAEEAASDWTLSSNIGFVSDYYFRGISQTWHEPTVQGGIDLAHSSGFYAGVWGSGVSPNTYPDATTEIDIYGGYNGTIASVDKLGYTVGLYGYVYPGGSWKKYNYLGVPNQTPDGGDWNTLEANFGLSYDWISAKVSVTLTDWFGAQRSTGWKDDTSGTTYFELNAAYPLPWGDLTLIAHVGYLNVASELNVDYVSSSGQQPSATSEKISPDYTDYKVGLSKSFTIAKSEGWNAGVYYVGADNTSYWGNKGYGGSSFNGSSETRNLSDGRFVLTVGRTF